MTRRRLRAQGGQALPLVLAAALALVLGAVALFVLGRVQLAAARAQTAADLAALSAGRALADDLGRMALDGPQRADAWRDRLAAAARRAAAPGGARVEDVRLPGASWPPMSVEVTVSTAGPRGSRARAVARAGLTAPGAPGDGRSGWAAGGGYSGPLRYRDGKPMCPAVAEGQRVIRRNSHRDADGVVGPVPLSFWRFDGVAEDRMQPPAKDARRRERGAEVVSADTEIDSRRQRMSGLPPEDVAATIQKVLALPLDDPERPYKLKAVVQAAHKADMGLPWIIKETGLSHGEVTSMLGDA